MEYENKYASRGVGNTALGLSIGAVAAELLGGGLGNGIGGILGGRNADYINKYEAAQSARIAELETEVKLRDANTYTDSKILDLYKYVDHKISGVEAQICQQGVVNAQVAANLSCLQGNVASLMALTKTIIPIDNICPPPMERYNSWVAPTATT